MNTSTSKPHPFNNDLVIIYVIGGVTSYEFKLIKDVLKEHQPGKNVKNYSFLHLNFSFLTLFFYFKILFGSSHFCNHSKLIKYLFN